MIIKKIIENKGNGQKFINVPKKCDFKTGDQILLVKLSEKDILSNITKEGGTSKE